MEELLRERFAEAERRVSAERERRLIEVRASLARNDRDPHAYIAVARHYKLLGRLYDALDILKRGVERCAPSAALYEYYIERLEKCNRTEEAIDAAHTAFRHFPDEWIFRLREALLLPILYDTPQQVETCRRHFTEGLHRIIREVTLDTPADRQRALTAVEKNVNKYLGYQGRNDRELQELYGTWVHRVMAANYPQWVSPRPMPPLPADGRLRVGYVSAHFREGSVAKAFFGWLRGHDRSQISLFAYYADQSVDDFTGQVRNTSDRFRLLPQSVEEAAPVILADELHILVFLDLNLKPWMGQLGALRLAPVQCMAWDYPVTSGLPTMDYFISGDLMEPEDAQQHYSEKLVRLPGIGICCTKSAIPESLLLKTRGEFGLREDAIVYFSCQSSSKYLPDQDALFAQIAARVPNSQFLFLANNEIVHADLERRLERAFAIAGLRAADHCILRPHVPLLEYWTLHRMSAGVLDTIGWSGGVSTLEAIATGTPVVTLPGSFMRGRQSYAYLTQLGVTETIARNESDYVDIAVRLGLDPHWRQGVIAKTQSGHAKLYSDSRSVAALESFYREVAAEGMRL